MARSPSQSASSDSSWPSRNSSATTVGVPEALLGEELLDRGARVCLVGANDHALAGRERVGLQHERIGGAREVFERLLAVVEHEVRGGRDAGRLHQFLCVGLRALDAGGRRTRTERLHAGVEAGIHEALDERRLRPDDDQVAVLLVRQRDQARDVVARHVEADDLVAGDPGVAGGRDHLRRLRAAQQRANERVLTPARPDYENLLQRASP